MKMLSLSSVLVAGLFSSSLALANHHDGPDSIAASAQELAAASEGLSGYTSASVPSTFVAAAAALHETA